MFSIPVTRPLPLSPVNSALAVLLVVIWLISMGWLLWYFEAQRLAADQQLLHFDARDLPPPPTSSVRSAKVLYFLEQGCRCSDAARVEIERLQHVAGTQLTQFVIADQSMVSAADAALDAQPVSAQERPRWLAVAPHTPAAALWDEKGTLIYYGPIGGSSGCGVGRSYLLSAWQRLAANQVAAFTSWDVVSCTCTSNQV